VKVVSSLLSAAIVSSVRRSDWAADVPRQQINSGRIASICRSK
jgi:hypothetical protein